tara:strand:- start:408 stop:908 length:501 start_codon:yes stop_codon:yes gene_type:complete
MSHCQNLRIGKIGEYLTASSLESLNVKCDIVSQEGFDILAYTNGIIIRVQVKSTACPRLNSKKEKRKKYIFLCAKSTKKIILTEDDCDVIALVAVDLKKVLYIPVTSLMGATHRVLPEDYEDTNLESESWNECLKSIAESSALRNNGRGGKPKRDRQLSSCDEASD